jgi:hypothetical protein
MKEMEQISTMKISSWAKYAAGVTLASAMLAACSAGGSSSFGPSGVPSASHRSGGVTLMDKMRDMALTMPHFVGTPIHNSTAKSFMLVNPDKKHKKKKKGLLYVGSYSNGTVGVYDYPAGTSAGTLSGFDGPYGMCSDSKGDVYIANFYGGSVVEYAYGGTSPINTYDSGGEPIGCGVDSKGDVAVTSFSPGELIVYAGGDPSKGTTYSDGSCPYTWAFGADSAGDWIGQYDDTVCALMSGSSSMRTLTESGITIDFPAGSSSDGKYFDLGDQEAGGTFLTGSWQTTISGTTITAVGSEIKYSDSCYSNYVDDVNPFYVANGVNIVAGLAPKKSKGATTMVGPNLWCYDAGVSKVDYWAYPAGGSPTGSLSSPPTEPYGAAVVWGK